MSTTCLDTISIEEEIELTPQMKKMKLSNSQVSFEEENHPMITLSKPKDQIKMAFPNIADEKIQEILEKTSNNIEEAIQIIHHICAEEKKADPAFKNLHTVGRKRGFNDMKTEKTEKRSKNESTIPIRHKQPQRKIANEIGELVDKILLEVGQLKTRQDIKSYLTNKIKEIMTAKKHEEGTGLLEMKKNIEKLVRDKKVLEMLIVTCYRKYEKLKDIDLENKELQEKLEKIKYELSQERSKAHSFALILNQSDHSSRINVKGPDDVC